MTATICKALSGKVNETAAPQDMVSGEEMRDRVRTKENGRRESIVAQSHNKTNKCSEEPQPRKEPFSTAKQETIKLSPMREIP
jgi:hypothetical protein